ncbi:hypothetical protein BB561_001298 [Smittium simulii]|uniref:YEATS domain-containing protein n=1 Tax=Smittium simulii TaxID=133385 RepID=A0A2T9YVA3_9FUNG|nr:hypothetical protein BB561_001298 [Smittium simulii]
MKEFNKQFKFDSRKLDELNIIIENEFDKEIELKNKEIEKLKESIKKTEALVEIIKSSIDNSAIPENDYCEVGSTLGFKARVNTRKRSARSLNSIQSGDLGYRQRLETAIISRLYDDQIFEKSSSQINQNNSRYGSILLMSCSEKAPKVTRITHKKNINPPKIADFLNKYSNPESKSALNLQRLLSSQQTKELDLTINTILHNEVDENEDENSDTDEETIIKPLNLSKLNSYAQLHKSYLTKPSTSNQINDTTNKIQISNNSLPTEPSNNNKILAPANTEKDIQLQLNKPRESRFHRIERVMVGNESRYILKDDNIPTDSQDTHIWTVYIRKLSDGSDLNSFIRKVRIFLHPSYKPNDIVDIIMPPFELSRPGWGEFPLKIQIYFSDKRNKPVNIVHILKLSNDVGENMVLGAEQPIDLELNKIIENKSTTTEALTRSLNSANDAIVKKNKIAKSILNHDYGNKSNESYHKTDKLTNMRSDLRQENNSKLSALGVQLEDIKSEDEQDILEVYIKKDPDSSDDLRKPISLNQEQLVEICAEHSLSEQIAPIKKKINLKTLQLNLFESSYIEPSNTVESKKLKLPKAEDKKIAVKITKTPREIRETLIDQNLPEHCEKILKFVKIPTSSKKCTNSILNHIFKLLTEFYPLIKIQKNDDSIKKKDSKHTDKAENNIIEKKYNPANSIEQWESIWTHGHRLFVEYTRAHHIFNEIKITFDGYELMDPRAYIDCDLVSDPDEFLYYVLELLDRLHLTETEIDSIVHDILVSKPKDMVDAIKTIQYLYNRDLKSLVFWLRENDFSLSDKILTPILDDITTIEHTLPAKSIDLIKTTGDTNKNQTIIESAVLDSTLNSNTLNPTLNTSAAEKSNTNLNPLNESELLLKEINLKNFSSNSVIPYIFYCKNCGKLQVEDFYKAIERCKSKNLIDNLGDKGNIASVNNFSKNAMLFCSADCMSIWHPIALQNQGNMNYGTYSTMSSVTELFDLYPQIFKKDKDIHNLTNQNKDAHSTGEVFLHHVEKYSNLGTQANVLKSNYNSASELKNLSLKIKNMTMDEIFSSSSRQSNINPNEIDWIWRILRPLELPTTLAARAIASNQEADELGYCTMVDDLDPSALEQRVVVGDLLYKLATIFLKDLISSSLEFAPCSSLNPSDNFQDVNKHVLLPTHVLSALSGNPNSFDFIINTFMGDGTLQ